MEVVLDSSEPTEAPGGFNIDGGDPDSSPLATAEVQRRLEAATRDALEREEVSLHVS